MSNRYRGIGRKKAWAAEMKQQPCHYCGGEGGTVDHVIPHSQGGPNRKENCVPACGPCNRKRGKLMNGAGYKPFANLRAIMPGRGREGEGIEATVSTKRKPGGEYEGF